MKNLLILFDGNNYFGKLSYKLVRDIILNINFFVYNITLLVRGDDGSWYLIDNYMDVLKNSELNDCEKKQVLDIFKFVSGFDKVLPIVDEKLFMNFLNLFNNKLLGFNFESFIIYNKRLSKIICTHYKIPIIPYIEINGLKKLKQIDIEFPVIVKGTCFDLGSNIANNIDELNKYIKKAYSYDLKLIVEKYIKARKFECVIFKDKKIRISDVAEMKNNEINDYGMDYIIKYKITCPAKINKGLENEIKKMSALIFDIFNIKRYAMFEFLYDYNNHMLYFNKVTTIPDFNKIITMFNHCKIDTKKVISSLIDDNN